LNVRVFVENHPRALAGNILAAPLIKGTGMKKQTSINKNTRK